MSHVLCTVKVFFPRGTSNVHGYHGRQRGWINHGSTNCISIPCSVVHSRYVQVKLLSLCCACASLALVWCNMSSVLSSIRKIIFILDKSVEWYIYTCFDIMLIAIAGIEGKLETGCTPKQMHNMMMSEEDRKGCCWANIHTIFAGKSLVYF